MFSSYAISSHCLIVWLFAIAFCILVNVSCELGVFEMSGVKLVHSSLFIESGIR